MGIELNNANYCKYASAVKVGTMNITHGKQIELDHI